MRVELHLLGILRITIVHQFLEQCHQVTPLSFLTRFVDVLGRVRMDIGLATEDTLRFTVRRDAAL